VKNDKFWPSVRRVDDAYGDRNLICTCAPIEAFADA
jgi:glycine dehydrogenase